jgi:hypothetical protein
MWIISAKFKNDWILCYFNSQSILLLMQHEPVCCFPRLTRYNRQQNTSSHNINAEFWNQTPCNCSLIHLTAYLREIAKHAACTLAVQLQDEFYDLLIVVIHAHQCCQLRKHRVQEMEKRLNCHNLWTLRYSCNRQNVTYGDRTVLILRP